MTSTRGRLAAEYVLPIRWDDDRGIDDLTEYLGRLAHWIDVTVVDGSDVDVFAAHARAWPSVRHVPPTGHGLNGKVRGALTGIRAARHDRVLIADDDVRYELDPWAAASTTRSGSGPCSSTTRRASWSGMRRAER